MVAAKVEAGQFKVISGIPALLILMGLETVVDLYNRRINGNADFGQHKVKYVDDGNFSYIKDSGVVTKLQTEHVDKV